jgi:hypothetical protein
MKHAIEMSSGAMTFIESLAETDSGIQYLIEEIHRHTDRVIS